MNNYRIASESVTEGHPDKVCDIICDAIVDAYIIEDEESKVGCEALVTENLVVVSGEIMSRARVNVSKVVREVIKNIGYIESNKGFDYKTCQIINRLSIEPYTKSVELGANDQGIVYGYAVDETEGYMPLSITLSNALSLSLANIRKTKQIKCIKPDGKTLVSVEYKGNRKRIDSVIVSTQHENNVELDRLRRDIYEGVILTTIPKDLLDDGTQIYINPAGSFHIGGPYGDTGLSGRKLMVDSYGSCCRHGGGALSGKDLHKVDRAGAYMARYLAKNIVSAELAARCEVSMVYAIGINEPIAIHVDTFGTGKTTDIKIEEIIKKNYDLSIDGISHLFDCRNHLYRFKDTACYGHFGRSDIEFPWEKISSFDLFKKYS